ncbi:hypothetical protein C8Q78DRAFT_399165 [Trametes maxima]|nr:hypothetical protein C8Q78DRAFT_399165 [Trametes maxima]
MRSNTPVQFSGPIGCTAVRTFVPKHTFRGGAERRRPWERFSTVPLRRLDNVQCPGLWSLSKTPRKISGTDGTVLVNLRSRPASFLDNVSCRDYQRPARCQGVISLARATFGEVPMRQVDAAPDLVEQRSTTQLLVDIVNVLAVFEEASGLPVSCSGSVVCTADFTCSEHRTSQIAERTILRFIQLSVAASHQPAPDRASGRQHSTASGPGPLLRRGL